MSGDAPVQAAADYAQGVVEVVGPDLERSLAFYSRLGFELLRHSGSFAVVQWRGQRLFLAEDPQAPTVDRWTNIRLMTDDVDVFHATVCAAGIEVVHPLGDRPYGLREFVVRDPSGFELRFAQPTP